MYISGTIPLLFVISQSCSTSRNKKTKQVQLAVMLQGDVHACTPSSIWSGPKDVSLVTAMCDRDYIADEAQMHRKLRCDTG